MRAWSRMGLTLALAAGIAAAAAQEHERASRTKTAASKDDGWQLPPDAKEKKNPLAVDAKVLATGKSVFMEKCKRCHGPTGVGDGPDADPDHRDDMDLTNPKRADRNPDGVVFYKVMNGRKKPKMPAQKDELTEQQVWSVVAYAQSLRKE